MSPWARYAPGPELLMTTTPLTDRKIKKYLAQGRYGSVCAACGGLTGLHMAVVVGKTYHLRCQPKDTPRHL